MELVIALLVVGVLVLWFRFWQQKKRAEDRVGNLELRMKLQQMEPLEREAWLAENKERLIKEGAQRILAGKGAFW